MINSDKVGHTFWIDQNDIFQSAPTFADETPDLDNAIPVEDWEGDDLTIEEFTDVIRIFQRLSSRRVTGVGGTGINSAGIHQDSKGNFYFNPVTVD